MAPDARERIQSFLDRTLLRHMFVPFDEMIGKTEAYLPSAGCQEPSPVLRFAALLGEEKASQIDSLKPSISQLGAVRLKGLIVDVFQRLTEEDGSEGELARRHNLSKASFSRFAGSAWYRGTEDPDKPKHVPVLWANMAAQLAHDAEFQATARDAGLWDFIREAAGAGKEETS